LVILKVAIAYSHFLRRGPQTMKRIVSNVGKAFGLLSAGLGGTVSIGLMLALLLGHPPGWAVAILITLLLFFGLVPLGLGWGILYASQRVSQQAIRDRFYLLIRNNRGRISLFDFSAATQLEPSEARLYLDRWARECDATFDVTDAGDIYYVFENAEPARLPSGTAPFSVEMLKQLIRTRL
jgi:hypothetical protein